MLYNTGLQAFSTSRRTPWLLQRRKLPAETCAHDVAPRGEPEPGCLGKTKKAERRGNMSLSSGHRAVKNPFPPCNSPSEKHRNKLFPGPRREANTAQIVQSAPCKGEHTALGSKGVPGWLSAELWKRITGRGTSPPAPPPCPLGTGSRESISDLGLTYFSFIFY